MTLSPSLALGLAALASPEARQAALAAAESAARPAWARIEATEQSCLAKVLKAFQDHQVGEHHFAGTTGYGHDDLGRAALEAVVAQALGAEAAIVRPHFASGTHAIAAALFGVLRPGQKLLYATGHPYDTLEEVIGLRGEGQGSLAEWGVGYEELALLPDGRMDLEGLRAKLASDPSIGLVAFQRSRGYAWRPSFRIADLAEAIALVKATRPSLPTFVDNCYGEFTEAQEPCEVGADLVAGSLIKNPGGGIVPSGGYVAGTEAWVHAAACRLTAPGVGGSGGATLDALRLIFQGFFMAPHTVAEALKVATVAAKLFADLGLQVSPAWDEPRTDIIQAIRFDEPKRLLAFCRGIQGASPVHGYVTPIPDVVPGYEDQVVMAAGTFIEGSTIELSADGPLRPPFVAYLQGGLSYAHGRHGLDGALARLAAEVAHG